MLSHLCLVGDGDEIDAVEDVERAFGVTIDTATAGGWRTVGDLHDALLPALPDYVAKQPGTWRRFRWALCQVSGDDPELVDRATLLIGPGLNLAAAIKMLFGRMIGAGG